MTSFILHLLPKERLELGTLLTLISTSNGPAQFAQPASKENTAMLLVKKKHHWLTRHSDLPKDMVHRPKPVTISVAHNLPEEQRAWCCPLCTAALPSLSDWDRKRAIRKHIEEAHPDETLQSLYKYRKKHIQKPGGQGS